MIKRCALLSLFALLGVSVVLGQGREVTGTVTDGTLGIALPGVNITIEGTTLGTTTALDGTYRIAIRGSSDVLLFSFVGFQTAREVVGDRSVIDVVMLEDLALLEEVVVIGYGVQRRGEVTGSTATLNVDDANKGLIAAPDEFIRGRIAGVTVTQNNGEPGSAFIIRIRGGTSISASNEPLYVIDGIPIDNSPITPDGIGISGQSPAARNPLNTINPNDIASMTILKDASATAIYGSRGANGVVLITTKQGSAGRLTVDYDGYVSAQSLANKLDLVSASEYRSFIADQVSAGNLTQAALDILGDANTDWQDEVMQTAIAQSHNLAFSGGTTDAQYRVSLGYLNQEGLIQQSGLERLTGRLNAQQNAMDGKLRLTVNLTSSFINDDFIAYNSTSGFEGAIMQSIFEMNPTFPVREGDEFFEIGPGRVRPANPVALANEIQDNSKTTRTLGNFSAEYDVLDNLTAKIQVGGDRAQASRRIFFPAASPGGSEFNGLAAQLNRERSSYTVQTYLTFDDTFKQDHDLNVLGGYEFNQYIVESFAAQTRDFVTDLTGFDALQAGAVRQEIASDKNRNRLISFFGRANYGFKDRYFLTAVLRYDGSSRFGSGNKWATFPALSAAWRISDEAFMSGNDFISDLRIKAGWGIVGSQEIGNNLALATLAADAANIAIIGGLPVTGFAPAAFANPDLKWEETSSINIGVDFGLSNGKYNGTIEYYQKNTTDLLLEISVPQPAPVPTRIENIGEVDNTGLELSFDALILDRPDLNLTIGGVFASNSNKVKSLGPRDQIITGTVQGRGQSGTFSQLIIPGEPLGTFFGPVFTGIENGAQQFADLDGDGTVEITSDDRQILGNAQPDFTYGLQFLLNYKEWDFSLFVRGEQGRDIFNNTALVYETKSSATQNVNFFASALDDGTALREPAKFSSRYIQDGSFLRIDNLTVGYTIDAKSLSQFAQRARVYVTVQNLVNITGYDGYDPEVDTQGAGGLAVLGVDFTSFPRPRTFTFGVSLGF